jgi:hypothetical protein
MADEFVEIDLTRKTNNELDALLKMRGARGYTGKAKPEKLKALGVENIGLGTTDDNPHLKK